MKYQHVAEVVEEILELCDVCKEGLVGVERHYNPSISKKCLQEKSSP